MVESQLSQCRCKFCEGLKVLIELMEAHKYTNEPGLIKFTFKILLIYLYIGFITQDIRTLLLFLCRGQLCIQEDIYKLEQLFYPYRSPEVGVDVLNQDYKYNFDFENSKFAIIWFMPDLSEGYFMN